MSADGNAIAWSTGGPSGSPGSSEVHLWRARLDAPPDVVIRFRALLLDEERQRADRFRFDVHRNRYVVSRAVLRFLLADYLGSAPREVSIAFGEHGKPWLRHPRSDLKFNLSHAAGLAVYAFASARRVGVDVEAEARDVGFRELAARFFSHREQEVLRGLPDSEVREAFYACWTRKEAYIKALGLGVTHGLDNFAVAFGAGTEAAVVHSELDPDASSRWTMRSFAPAPGFAGALVVEGRDWDLHAFDVPVATAAAE